MLGSPATTLARPLPLRDTLVLPNRLAKAAMSEDLADEDGGPSERLVRLYETLGRGGAGLLLTGNVVVAQGGRTEPHNVVIEDDRHLPALKRWAEAASRHGARVFMQVSHAGRQSPRAITRTPVSPSAVQLRGGAGLFARPRPLSDAEIRGLVDRFAHAASLAATAGFAGVQIHGAHGYLVSQFLSPLTNQREDGWGGSLEGRMRFLLQIVRGSRAAVGPRVAVAVKLNSADFQRGGFTLEESILVAQALEAEGIDLLEISGGSYEAPRMVGRGAPVRESTRQREAFFLEYAERMRESLKVPLMLTGGFRTAAAMAAAIDSGAIDVVGIARPITLDPDLPARLLSSEIAEATEIVPSIGIRRADDLLQVAWFQRQLHRIADGLAPDPGLGRWSTVLRTGVQSYGRWLANSLRRSPADVLAPPHEVPT
jgi:2,4-dienoyl-CoA reductase-like NADH-dependent reductase (Old Yellow Enzyme family)